MEPLLELRVSRVAPTVENNLVQLVDLVKQMGRKNGNLSESQNRRMVSYLGNLDEMRSQLVIMIQRYEEDSHVLKRLLELVDRIDDVKQLALAAEESKDKENSTLLRYNTPFNPLMVSTLNILDVSGLFASRILGLPTEDEDEETEEVEEKEEDTDAFWDHQDDPALLAPESEPHEVSAINLSVSNLHLPSLFDSSITPTTSSTTVLRSSSASAPELNTSREKIESVKDRIKMDTVRNNLSLSDSNLPSLFDSQRAAAASLPPPPPPPPQPQPHQDTKGKGKERRQLGVDLRKQKGKAKAVTFRGVSSSESGTGSETDSESGSDDEDDGPNGAQPTKVTLGWTRTLPGPMKPTASSSSSSSSARPTRVTRRDSSSTLSSSSASESESETSSGSETERSLRVSSQKQKVNRRKGPCDAPVLCKICYDEYESWDVVHQFQDCEHVYCRDCLKDYLATHITEGAVLDLTCPFPECKTEFLPVDIKLLAALRADPNARWCPNPYCNNGIKHNPETMPWVYCNACKFEFCFHCMAERHDGAACGKEALEYLQKKHESELEASKQFEEWTALMQALVKPCPGCKAFIEKNDGCNHMTCTNPACRVQFCWLCLNLYSGDHFMDDINFPNCYDKQYWTPPEILLQTANIYPY